MAEQTPLQPNENESETKEQGKPAGFFAVVQSTLAALLGVQSSKNRERDFKQADASQYIVAGVIATLVILISMYALVSYVISTAKPH
ncbi:MAG TPA: DUF2970 domain-containing protein [Pseudomonadales bacterium]|nr:DUF2970 domain-containing protein [Pseudomonadales bacterium]